MTRRKGIKGILTRKNLIDVDLSGKNRKVDERLLKKSGFGMKTVTLNLSNTSIGLDDVTALRDYINLLNGGKGIKLKVLDLNNNGFPKADHTKISKIIKEISKMMAVGKMIKFRDGNNGFNTPYTFLPDHDDLFGSLRLNPPLEPDFGRFPYKSTFLSEKPKKRKSDLFSCFSFLSK
mmetsp:Transcript_21405/g.27350  ORF Transcript_21405/g.27350 Transcript_21405/m.27350 type:complete len:177 (+) Transcript_21405:283-813(+)